MRFPSVEVTSSSLRHVEDRPHRGVPRVLPPAFGNDPEIGRAHERPEPSRPCADEREATQVPGVEETLPADHPGGCPLTVAVGDVLWITRTVGQYPVATAEEGVPPVSYDKYERYEKYETEEFLYDARVEQLPAR